MLHLSSWMVTLPMMLIGMVGIILVIGIIVLSVMTTSKYSRSITSRVRHGIARKSGIKMNALMKQEK